MDKTYILEQGYLELYVLGELDKDDTMQVEAALAQHPDLRKMRDTIEANFENLAFENAVKPRSNIKEELLKKLSEPQLKTLSENTKDNYFKPLSIAASIAALLLIGTVYLITQLSSTNKQLKLVEDQNQELNIQVDQLVKDIEKTQRLFSSINNPDTKKYVLLGNSLMPEAKVVSYVNDEEKTVLVNTTYLPKLEDSNDYQMWADVDGEMINMGVINTEEPILALNYIENSESLNITIEPAGGSDHPTVSNLITNIYLK